MAEERVKPRSMYVEEAIQAALESRWADALEINQALLERHGPDEDLHNRMGKALTELGRLDEALDAYSASLQLNPLNLIAQKNVRKLSSLREQKDAVRGTTQAIDVELFTEEPGKSALTVLRPPERGVTVAVAPGDVVELHPSGAQLLAETSRGVSLGDVEPKLARRLLPLMHSGNRYTAAVARVDEQGEIEIIIREVFQSPENARKSSFPLSRTPRRDDFRPYAKDTLLGAREAADGALDEEESEDGLAESGSGGDELEEMGMSTFQADAAEEPAEADADEDDEGRRPEDEY